MITAAELIAELMKDQEFREAWERLAPEFEAVHRDLEALHNSVREVADRLDAIEQLLSRPENGEK